MAHMKIKYISGIVVVITKFRTRDIFTHAAAGAFYAVLSIFPFLIILLCTSSLFLKESVSIEKIRLTLRLFPPAVIDRAIANLENILESGQVLSLISLPSLAIKGAVNTLDLRQTRLRSFDGKDIYIPDTTILKIRISIEQGMDC